MIGPTHISDPQAAIRGAFQESEKQIEAYKSSIRGEHWWKRVERRQELNRRKTGTSQIGPVGDPQWFFALVEPHTGALRDVSGRVLRYVEARGDLPQNALELDDVVDAALARAYDKFAREHVPENIRSRLMRFALDEIKAAVKRSNTGRERTVRIEQDIPEISPTDAVSTLGDGILDLYQPDEDLKVEDGVSDIEVPTRDENRRNRRVAALREARGGPAHARRCANALTGEACRFRLYTEVQ